MVDRELVGEGDVELESGVRFLHDSNLVVVGERKRVELGMEVGEERSDLPDGCVVREGETALVAFGGADAGGNQAAEDLTATDVAHVAEPGVRDEERRERAGDFDAFDIGARRGAEVILVAPVAIGEVVEVGFDAFGAVELDRHQPVLGRGRWEGVEPGFERPIEVPLPCQPSDVRVAGKPASEEGLHERARLRFLVHRAGPGPQELSIGVLPGLGVDAGREIERVEPAAVLFEAIRLGDGLVDDQSTGEVGEVAGVAACDPGDRIAAGKGLDPGDVELGLGQQVDALGPVGAPVVPEVAFYVCRAVATLPRE